MSGGVNDRRVTPTTLYTHSISHETVARVYLVFEISEIKVFHRLSMVRLYWLLTVELPVASDVIDSTCISLLFSLVTVQGMTGANATD
jgi:hypothetical protein